MPTGPPTEHGARGFYARIMQLLTEARLPFLVGGGLALGHYTGVERDNKDFDLFVRRRDYEAVMAVLSKAGYRTELTFPHWLGKVWCGQDYADVIFNSGNGVSAVDEDWFRHSSRGTVFGVSADLSPVEEMIWSKAFIMERERYDAADIMHLILAQAEAIDWPRLLSRFGSHWRVLFSHLCLFGFVYPAERARIPEWVVRELMARMDAELKAPPPSDKTCQGTLLSREQYLVDVQRWGLPDARHGSDSAMTESDVALWTRAIEDKDNT